MADRDDPIMEESMLSPNVKKHVDAEMLRHYPQLKKKAKRKGGKKSNAGTGKRL